MKRIDAEFLAGHIAYSRWATFKQIDAARALTEEELRRDQGNSFGGVLATLTHIFAADRIWLSRLTGAPRLKLLDDGEELPLAALEVQWPSIYDGLTAHVRGTDVDRILTYKNLRGETCELPVWQVILHLVNHGTYHRGQVTTMLKQLGHNVVSTDLVFYYLELARAAKAS